jgi:membrane-bound lytic murein transglycosylase A
MDPSTRKAIALCLLFLPLLALGGLPTGGCTRIHIKETPQKEKHAAEIEQPPVFPTKIRPQVSFIDQITGSSFHQAVERQKESWKKISAEKRDKEQANFGTRSVTIRDMENSLHLLDFLLTNVKNPRLLDQFVRNYFDIYQMTGKKNQGDVLMTGYYHPLIRGSLTRSNRYPYPLYRRPNDLITIDLGEFSDEYRGKRIIGRLKGNSVIPYYNRKEIDRQGKLSQSGLELAWVSSDLDRFFLQIQGSGSLLLDDGSHYPVNYDGQNGHSYVSIGRKLIYEGYLSSQELSMQTIRELLDYDEQLAQEFMDSNPSYVFFHKGSDGPKGAGGAVITPGRSVAMDTKLYPLGIPIFVQAHRSAFNEEGKIDNWQPTSGFMINQDTGGAIKGPGRVDLYQGSGPVAELTAGHLANYGTVFFLLIKKDLDPNEIIPNI